MTLNSSGPISLAGTTTGQSIEVELGGGGTTQISLNDTNVRTLAGVASGAITMPTNFYGKSNASSYVFLNYDSANGLYSGGVKSFYVDSSGNSYFFGTSSTGATSILTKVSGSGTQVWAFSIANSTVFSVLPNAVVDSSGNLFVTAQYPSSGVGVILFKISSDGSTKTQYLIHYGAGSNPNINNPGSVKLIYNSSGNIDIFGYCVGIISPSYYGIIWVTVDTSGNVVSGYYISSSGSNFFVIDVTYDGTYYYMLWAYTSGPYAIQKFLGSSSSQYSNYINNFTGSGKNIAVDSSGNTYVLANFTVSGGAVPTIVKHDSSGAVSSAVRMNSYINASQYVDAAQSLTIDSSGNIYFSYYIRPTSGAGVSVTDTYTLVVTKFNSSLALQWTNTLELVPYSGPGSNRYIGGLEYWSTLYMDSSNNYFYWCVSVTGLFGSTTNGYGYAVLKLPTDGSLSGSVLTVNGYPFYYGTTFQPTWLSISPTKLSASATWGSFTPASTSTVTSYTFNNLTTASQYFSGNTFTSGYGSAVYPLAGTYSWLCPSGVTSVSVVCVGSGGAGGQSNAGGTFGGSGGGGGGLGYVNNYSVTAGNSYTVVVGQAVANASGYDSYFVNRGVVVGYGGSQGSTGQVSMLAPGGTGGSYGGTGGGNGGTGGDSKSSAYTPGGGGGAGGYSGAGGNGGAGTSSTITYAAGNNAASGSGGGGGGTSGTGSYGANAGGGVNVIGKGSDGSGGSGGGVPTSATSGSYGPNYSGIISKFYTGNNGMSGMSAGGGGGGGQLTFACCCGYYYSVIGQGGSGGTGIVRIIWPGSSRSFPSTNAGSP